MADARHPSSRVGGRATIVGTAAGAIVGGVFLATIAGSRLLDPTQIDWAMKLDWVHHYFGWHYFRIEPWHWPPGAIHGYNAPLGSSIGMTDSIPLAAYLLKPLAPWLPSPFQYLSAWWLLCFALQGAMGARLTSRASASPLVQALGGTLFVLLPTLLVRIGHAALCSHWLILWALLVATRGGPARVRSWEWAMLSLVAGLIHPYLAAMTLVLLGAAAWSPEGGVPWRRRLGAATAAGVAMLAGWWLSGLFILGEPGALQLVGLGDFSTNLLAPITPTGWSGVLPEVSVASDGQRYEGFHYLGLGVLGLCLAAGVLARVQRRPAAGTRMLVPVVAAGVLMAIFALSPRVTLGPWVVVDVSGPLFSPLSMFRASGRFTWPLTYIVLTASLWAVVRRLPTRRAAGLLGLAVVVQLWDLHAAHLERWRTARDDGFLGWTNPLPSARWPQLLAGNTEVILVDPPDCGPGPVPYQAVLRLAALNGLGANVGTVSRQDSKARAAYCEALHTSIDTGALQARTVYLVGADEAGRLARQPSMPGGCTPIDGLWACGATIAPTRP